MSRLIDADTLVHDLAEWYVKESPRMSGHGNQAVADMIWEFIRVVNKRPTVDAIPVVRCKDCKHSDTFPVCGEPYSFPLKCLLIRYGGVFEDWFCEHGERR